VRPFTSEATDDVRHTLGVLIDPTSPHEVYQRAMTDLGHELGIAVARRTPASDVSTVCIVCTVEDADYLARGLIDGMEETGFNASQLKLVCFWNERVRRLSGSDKDAFDVAPVIKQYREASNLDGAVIVVVKSIISGACVVKTNLAMLIDDVTPSKVVVAAPVMLKGAKEKLASEFTQDMASRFEYLTFAMDDQKGPDENVLPGIGGSVYERLGFENKNAYVPDLVRQRRNRLALI